MSILSIILSHTLALQKMQSPKVMEYWNNSTRWRVEKEQLIPLAVGILAYIGLETLFIILNLQLPYPW